MLEEFAFCVSNNKQEESASYRAVSVLGRLLHKPTPYVSADLQGDDWD